MSAQAVGGSGQLQITALDTDAKTVSGTFSFVGFGLKVTEMETQLLMEMAIPFWKV